MKPSLGMAMVFDVDGVLLHGKRPIAGATEALHMLNSKSVPWMLFTNSGGKAEADRVSELSKQLSVPIDVQQFCQSHTPFQDLSHKYKTILVCGGSGDVCKKVAEGYGFNDVVQPVDILASTPEIWPFHEEIPDYAKPRDFTKVKFDAIFVFNDPRNQVSGSAIWASNFLLKVWFCMVHLLILSSDLLWSNEYPFTRYGQGAFRICVERLYHELTGNHLRSTVIGKPFPATYKYASNILSAWSKLPLHSVYMVGDNPASDIRGANEFGWHSILVKTGVWRGEKPQWEPNTISENVLDAVQFAIGREEGST